MKLADPVIDESHIAKRELAAEVLRSSGCLRLRVTGRSMLPTIWPGDMLIIEPLGSSSVAEGEIVLFDRLLRLVAHRVVRKEDSRVLTRGDALAVPDAPLDENELMGRVSFILRNGKHIRPRATLRVTERALAALVRRSRIAATVVVRARRLLQTSVQPA